MVVRLGVDVAHAAARVELEPVTEPAYTLIIAGSRNVRPWVSGIRAAVEATGWGLPSQVIAGGARGVDEAGALWAQVDQIPVVVMPADWVRDGKRAGPIRNRAMAAAAGEAGRLLAIWDGVSRGTADMIEVMRALGRPIYIVSTRYV